MLDFDSYSLFVQILVGSFHCTMKIHVLLPASRAQSVRLAGPKITLRFPRLLVYIYIFVRPHLSRAQ